MTDLEIQTYYSNLLIKQFASKPKAIAHIQALAGSLIIGQVFTAVQNSYNLPTAQGVQLDVLGKYLGVSRQGNTFSGPVVLSDAQYLIMLQLAAIRNHSDATLFELQQSIETYFAGVMRIYDYQDMSISYIIDPSLFASGLAEFALLQGLLPKPAAVLLRGTIVAPINTPFFGWVSYADPIPFTQSPKATYANYTSGHPWLSYYNVLGSEGYTPVSSTILTEGGDVLTTEGSIPIDTE